MSEKPGFKTSEFWVTVVVGVLGAIVTAVGIQRGDDGLTAIGGVMATLASGGYATSRGVAKAKK